MKVVLNSVLFKAQPPNYTKIDDTVSRSAQPAKEDFKWLKEQGVSDIINFRTMYKPDLNFSEKNVVESLGMNYHNIPTVSATPQQEGVNLFLRLIENIKQRNGKVHIHCKAGADRTGMYSFIYKMLNGIGNLNDNKAEWISHGHNTKRYPDMIAWAENILKKLK